MTTEATIHGQSIRLEYSGYRDGEFVFTWAQGEGGEISLKTPLSLNQGFQEKEFEIYFLAKHGIRENDTLQIIEDSNGDRIGLCTPINALNSNLHDLADKPFFQNYAYKSIEGALRKLGDEIYKKHITLDEKDSLQLTDIFHDYTAILAISKENLKDNFEFDLKRAIPSLFKHGYIPLSTLSPEEIKHITPPPENKKLKIHFSSRDIDNTNVISSILGNTLAYEKAPLFKFFYIYQIIELLMDSIFRAEHEKTIAELIQARTDLSKTKEVLSSIQDSTSEKKRIALLINKYSNVTGELDDLKQSCNSLLKELGKKEGSGFEDYLYTIRNFIFHQYRDFPQSKIDMLSDVTSKMIDVLPKLLSTYKST